MKEPKKSDSIRSFSKDELKQQGLIKGGPVTSKGTETEVQDIDD